MTPLTEGLALHIGLNEIDPRSYDGWNGRLDAGENDALAMAELTESLGYETTTLLSHQATAEAVLEAIRDAADRIPVNGIVVITYAGHGGQFEDLGDDEEDRRDETWLLYDREVLDDEIRDALSFFRAGVRVVVLSDSCHSGTVVRGVYERAYEDLPEVRAAYHRVAATLPTRSRTRGTGASGPRLRGAPVEVQRRVLRKHRDQYVEIRRSVPRDATPSASLILLSGCQDNQESMEIDGHGVFTAALLDHFERPEPNQTYRSLHTSISREMPPTQSPGLLTLGPAWQALVEQTPFEIQPPTTSPSPDAGAHVPSPQPEPTWRFEVDVAEQLSSPERLGRLTIEYRP